MNVKRGDVVLVPFPFAGGGGVKRRPALVVQSDHNNSRLANTILAQITTRIRFVANEPTQLLLELSSHAGKQSGLLHDSAVSYENLITVLQADVVRVIGTLPDDTMLQINDCLKAALSLD
ncbi:type II toxin-antitoxin system PemK/MazF family toxin [Calycomorphotria hydatis]|uniref:mRNA interferase EndoA n=1 Tax=Calycomorphotria hydatis TaxID=2528027 RepID=A0A517TB05_9PLAN|nr:type II toxin-antitoxin system PemK/MazF family toxin [Calycomorphotria hydatis]QDT65558.1 mRNA interferase EndoA [Calycomorphotria hydatis]